MPASSFFWHDYETFGRVPRRDRPAQFAGVRTDLDLNEIEAPVMHYCQPAPDTLPDPESVLLTGILPQHCLQQGLPEHAFADAVMRELGRPGSIGVGYNSIRFDDEVTRFLFWRNLLDPYAREWRDGCSRWDLMDTVRCAYALRPEGIAWPTDEAGRVSFKLERLTAANGLAHEAAHDALSDVRATLALARLVKARHPRLWDFCLALREKAAVQAQIVAGRPLLHVSGRYPVERGCLAIVWPFAPHPTNRNEVIVWDLAHDPEVLMSLDAAQIRARLFVRQEDLPEGVSRLPIKTLHINKSPVVVANLNTLDAALAERWGIDKAQADAFAQKAARISGDMLGVWERVFAREAPARAPDVDEDLYGGFLHDDDRRRLQQLRALPPEAMAAARPAFRDGRLEELVFRFRARNFPGSLAPEEAARWQRHCAGRLHEGEGGAMTLSAFQARVDELVEHADERGQGLLEALLDYAEAIAPDA